MGHQGTVLPPADVVLGEPALDPIFVFVSDAAFTTNAIDIVNVTGEAGVLMSISILVTTNVVTSGNTSVFEITIDGGTTRTIKSYNSQTVFSDQGIAQFRVSDGSFGEAAGDCAIMFFNVKYLTSLKVVHNVTSGSGNAGAWKLGCWRGVALP